MPRSGGGLQVEVRRAQVGAGEPHSLDVDRAREESGVGREGGTFSREFFTEPKAVVMQIDRG